MAPYAILHRVWRRLTVAGVDTILDYEISVLQVVLASLDAEAREKLAAQLARYDRINRSPNKTKQKFIDDDSNSKRTDWPSAILFEDSGLVHSGDITLRHVHASKPKVTAKLFFLSGRFDGCDFDRSHTKGVPIEAYEMRKVMSNLNSVTVPWTAERVVLFTPLGAEPSKHTFVPA